MTTLDLRQKRGEAIAAAEKLLRTADDQSRSMTPEEEQQYDRAWAEQAELQRQIERAESLERVKLETSQIIGTVSRVVETQKRYGTDSQEYRSAFDTYLRTGQAQRATMEAGTTTEGGYAVPTNMLARIIELTREANIIRQIAQVITTNGTTTIPTISANATSYWKAEEAASTQGEPTLGQASLGAYKATCLALVTEELLQDAIFDLEGFLGRNMGESIGALEETAFIAGAGSGSDCPLGLVGGTCQASTSSITTANATAITAAELRDMFHALAPRYRKNATWIMNDSTIKLISKLTDAVTGQFLWQPGLQQGYPDILLGRPVFASANMPAATAALKAVVFGDFNYCIVADRSPVQVQRLNERYAEYGEVGFRAWKRVDMAVTQSAAIQYSTMHA